MAGRLPGCKKTGGRVAGVPNKMTAAKVAGLLEAEKELGARLSEAEAKALKPLDVLLMVMRMALKAGNSQLAVACAEKSAPYCHARLSNMELQANVTRSVRDLSNEELMALVAEGNQQREDEPERKH